MALTRQVDAPLSVNSGVRMCCPPADPETGKRSMRIAVGIGKSLTVFRVRVRLAACIGESDYTIFYVDRNRV